MQSKATLKLASNSARRRVKAAIQALINADSTTDLATSVAQMRAAVESLKDAVKIIEAELPKKRKAQAKKPAAKKAKA